MSLIFLTLFFSFKAFTALRENRMEARRAGDATEEDRLFQLTLEAILTLASPVLEPAFFSFFPLLILAGDRFVFGFS